MGNFVFETSGAAGAKALNPNGVNVITGGTGIADLTLAAPFPGYRCVIRVASLSSGSVVVTSAAGTTLNGTNNTATFDAAEETLELIYKSSTAWAIVRNDGAVGLSTV